jgi:hypothetical protein
MSIFGCSIVILKIYGKENVVAVESYDLLQNLGHLVRMPVGCGEQNMILFVPNLHVINYLNATQQEDLVLKAEAIKNMEKGQYFILLNQVSGHRT